MLIFARRGANTLHGLSQSVRIFMNIFERHRLGTDVASAQGVISITSNIDHCVTLCLNHQTTHGFTKMTDAMVRLYVRVGHTMLTLSNGDRPWSRPVMAPSFARSILAFWRKPPGLPEQNENA
jgi:hypothetical protein